MFIKKRFLLLFLASLNMFCFSFGFTGEKYDSESKEKIFHYFCTASNSSYFPILLNLIGSIHEKDFDALDQIAIFDIGLTQEQRNLLSKVEKTQIYDIKKIHRDIIKPLLSSPGGRMIPGFFSWKPVLLMQALEMFPYFLYLDAGFMLLNSPDDLFKHIKQNGYFLMEIPHCSISGRITKPVIDKVVSQYSAIQQTYILDNKTPTLLSAVMGISNKVFDNFILPGYKLAFDISLFADDGSAPLGFGEARHDQTLLSILAHMEGLLMNRQGWSSLNIDGKAVPFHIHSARAQINNYSCLYHCRGDIKYFGDKTKYIHWRK